jgi:hypothetical protein
MGVRQKNWRVVGAGALLLVLAVGFFVVMMGMAARSNDPAGLMQTVGEVTGVGGGISAMMIALGMIGRRVETAAEGE